MKMVDAYLPQISPTDALNWDLTRENIEISQYGYIYFSTYTKKEWYDIKNTNDKKSAVDESNSKIIALVGESGSGKSSIQDELTKIGYEKIITYTTRPMREEDVDGKTYHFVADDEFEDFKSNGLFAETAEYNGWKYGSDVSDYQSGKKVIILTPKGLRSIKNKGIDVTSIYIDVPRRDRLIKILQRGDNIEEACLM